MVFFFTINNNFLDNCEFICEFLTKEQLELFIKQLFSPCKCWNYKIENSMIKLNENIGIFSIQLFCSTSFYELKPLRNNLMNSLLNEIRKIIIKLFSPILNSIKIEDSVYLFKFMKILENVISFKETKSYKKVMINIDKLIKKSNDENWLSMKHIFKKKEKKIIFFIKVISSFPKEYFNKQDIAR